MAAYEGPLTASAVMRFLAQLEESSDAYYRALGARFGAQADVFERCAAICARNRVQVARTYQETISDALEAGYAFEGLDLARYEPGALGPAATLEESLAAAAALERSAAACYEDVAERSGRLLATIPRALQRAAEGRRRNLAALAALSA